jgi:hypothetical protein
MAPIKSLTMVAFALLSFTSVALSQRIEGGDNVHTFLAKHDAAVARAHKAHKRRLEIDAAHKVALRQIPTPPAPTDPWAAVR